MQDCKRLMEFCRACIRLFRRVVDVKLTCNIWAWDISGAGQRPKIFGLGKE